MPKLELGNEGMYPPANLTRMGFTPRYILSAFQA